MKVALAHFFNRKLIFFLFISLLIISFLFLFSFEKEALHLAINKYHNSFFDLFFKYVTHLGDGIVFPIVIIGLILYKRKYATAYIISGFLTLVLSQIFKNWISIGYPRPFKVFGESLYLIEGVTMSIWYSFPSGHTTSAFALFILTILYTKKTSLQLFLFFLAVIVAWSRVYLSQHFLQDIVGGAILGPFIALASFQIAQNYSFFKK